MYALKTVLPYSIITPSQINGLTILRCGLLENPASTY